MARTGIELADVEQAAIQLQGQGKAPTVDGIRALLGTGSKTTIANYLKTWKSTHQASVPAQVPSELLALVGGLWEQLQRKADARIGEAQNSCNLSLQKMEQTLTQLYDEQAALKIKLHEAEECAASERYAKNTLDQNLKNEQQARLLLETHHLAATQQIEGMKTEHERLHQLATHMQHNLEHYQTAIQQLRIEQTVASEKMNAHYQLEISDYKKQREVLHLHLKNLEETVIAARIREEHYATLQKNHTQTLQQIKAATEEIAVLKERVFQTENALKIQHHEATQRMEALNALEKQKAILEEQNRNLQVNAKKLEDKVEVLRHEKLLLLQEKAQLEGFHQSGPFQKSKTCS